MRQIRTHIDQHPQHPPVIVPVLQRERDRQSLQRDHFAQHAAHRQRRALPQRYRLDELERAQLFFMRERLDLFERAAEVGHPWEGFTVYCVEDIGRRDAGLISKQMQLLQLLMFL